MSPTVEEIRKVHAIDEAECPEAWSIQTARGMHSHRAALLALLDAQGDWESDGQAFQRIGMEYESAVAAISKIPGYNVDRARVLMAHLTKAGYWVEPIRDDQAASGDKT